MANLDNGDVTAPARRAEAVTPSDSNDLPFTTRALYIGSDGNIVLDAYQGDTSVTFAAVKAGTILPVMVKRVRSTGTTATGIVALGG